MLRRRLTLPLGLFSALLLAGCAGLRTNEVPPPDAVAVASWLAEGDMRFRCDYDEKGFYWVFVGPDAKLWNDTAQPKRLEARLTDGFTVRHRDGSVLTARILENRGDASGENLKDAVFETTPPEKGALRGVRWMERRHAVGGMPVTRCSPSQRGMTLRVPFTSRWILYR